MTDGHSNDERLANLLADLADRIQRQEPVELEQVCRENPDLAKELRELWGAVLLADAVGSSPQANTQQHLRQEDALAASIALPKSVGDYQLQEVIGRGGMGVVFRAHQHSLNREVAVKMILRGQFATDVDRERFQAEAEAAARLHHPGIVPVYEVGESNGQPYFSMKLIEGVTLAEKLATGPFSSHAAAKIALQVSRAVHFAHVFGLLHRDLKPSNILIDNDGHPHITDFGLAKKIEPSADLTHSGSVLGTPAYMSPEQASGTREQIGPTSDVYSLGSILYHMLTGQPTFQAATPIDAMLMLREQDVIPPRVVLPHVARDLEMITLKCLQKPTDLRYQSALLLADDLEAFLNDEPISASSGRFVHVIARLFRETHHAIVLENWGMLWMWHSLVLLMACFLTNTMYLMGFSNRWYFIVVWTLGLGTWAAVFWRLRRRMGPVTFVERQIAHVWAASMAAISLLFFIEWMLDLPVLALSPVVGLVAGMVFLIKAGILSGLFYFQATALFATSFLMASYPRYAHFIFGIVSASCFWIPGLQYYWQRKRAREGQTS